MSTTTKKELIDRIADETGQSRNAVKKIVQCFLNQVIRELSEGNRLEFRDFGVFEARRRSERAAQNPRTLKPIIVPASNTVRFKAGRLMKMALDGDIDPDSLTAMDNDATAKSGNNSHTKSDRAGAAGSDGHAAKRRSGYQVFAGGRNPRQ
jgi:integration host factor subunit beta